MRAAIGSALLVCAVAGVCAIPAAFAQEPPAHGPAFVGIVDGNLRVGPARGIEVLEWWSNDPRRHSVRVWVPMGVPAVIGEGCREVNRKPGGTHEGVVWDIVEVHCDTPPGDLVVLGTEADDRVFVWSSLRTHATLFGGNDRATGLNDRGEEDPPEPILDEVEEVFVPARARSAQRRGGGGPMVVDAGDGDDRVTTARGKDRLSGGAGRDRLSAGGGADLLNGGPGADRLNGGRGNDTLRGGPGRGDRCAGGAGRDRIWVGGRTGCERYS